MHIEVDISMPENICDSVWVLFLFVADFILWWSVYSWLLFCHGWRSLALNERANNFIFHSFIQVFRILRSYITELGFTGTSSFSSLLLLDIYLIILK